MELVDLWNYRGYRVEVFHTLIGYQVRLSRGAHTGDIASAGAHWLLPVFNCPEDANIAARDWVKNYGVNNGPR